MRKFQTIGMTALALTALAVPQARAEEWAADQGGTAKHNGYFGVELGVSRQSVTGGDGSITTLAPVLSAGFGLGASLRLSLALPLTYGSISPSMGEGASSFRVGNPYVGVMYRLLPGPLELEAGIGLALPLAQLSKDSLTDLAASLVALGVAAGIHGQQNLWLWAPNTLSVVIPARLGSSLGPVKFGADAALAIFADTGDDRQQTDTGLQLGADATFGLGLVDVGARIAGVWMLTADGDNLQTSLEPFVQFGLGPAALRAGFLINLDAPAGPSFDDGKIWGLRLAASVGF